VAPAGGLGNGPGSCAWATEMLVLQRAAARENRSRPRDLNDGKANLESKSIVGLNNIECSVRPRGCTSVLGESSGRNRKWEEVDCENPAIGGLVVGFGVVGSRGAWKC
jgi:hypothetical protein